MNIRTTRLILVAILALSAHAVGQDREYRMKAVFLDKFTHFVQWPAQAVGDTSSTFVIGVIGDSPFGTVLEQIYAERKVKDKPVDIRYLTTLNEITECHLLFIAQSAADQLPDIIARTRGRPILTVSDTDGFAARSVLINLYKDSGKVKFEINESAVHTSGLTFSYMLLNLARIVNPVR